MFIIDQDVMPDLFQGGENTKIKTVKDVVDVSNKIIGELVSHEKLTAFILSVDHEDGTLSTCAFTPVSKISATFARTEPEGTERGYYYKNLPNKAESFLAVEDYTKIMLLLLGHPKIRNLEYYEKDNSVMAIFVAPEMQEVDRLEHPGEEL